MDRQTLAYSHPDPPRTRHSQWGMVSLALAVAVGAGMIGLPFLLAIEQRGRPTGGSEPKSLTSAVGFVLLVAWLTAIVVALGGLFERNTKRLLPVLALVTCVADVFLPLLLSWLVIRLVRS